jgi:hypothetical protein
VPQDEIKMTRHTDHDGDLLLSSGSVQPLGTLLLDKKRDRVHRDPHHQSGNSNSKSQGSTCGTLLLRRRWRWRSSPLRSQVCGASELGTMAAEKDGSVARCYVRRRGEAERGERERGAVNLLNSIL